MLRQLLLRRECVLACLGPVQDSPQRLQVLRRPLVHPNPSPFHLNRPLLVRLILLHQRQRAVQPSSDLGRQHPLAQPLQPPPLDLRAPLVLPKIPVPDPLQTGPLLNLQDHPLHHQDLQPHHLLPQTQLADHQRAQALFIECDIHEL